MVAETEEQRLARIKAAEAKAVFEANEEHKGNMSRAKAAKEAEASSGGQASGQKNSPKGKSSQSADLGGTGAWDQIGNAGISSGNPYAAAAGLGVKVLAAGEAKKRKKYAADAQRDNDKRDRIAASMSQLAGIYQGMRPLA